MASAEVRRLACVVPGAGAFPVEVRVADGIDGFKQAIRHKRPKLSVDEDIQVFPLLLENNSDDVRRLVRGDASARVRELMEQGEIDLLASVDKVFGDAPREGVVHVLATTPGWSSTRKLTCLVPGAGAFSVEVRGADDIDGFKQAIRHKRPKLFVDEDIQVFPLLLESNSDDTRRLVQGDASARVLELIARGEIDLLASVDDVFGDAPHKGVVHVLATVPGWSSTRKLVCVVPGAESFKVEVKGADDIDSLKQAIRDKQLKLFKDVEVQVFSLLCEDDSDDVRRLVQEDASARVQELMKRGSIGPSRTVDAVFGDAPREGVVHVLATTPGWSSTRKLTCVVPGAESYEVELRGADDIDTLKHAIQAKQPEFFKNGIVQVFPLLLEHDNEDVRLLERGEASPSVWQLMTLRNQLRGTVDDAFRDGLREGVVHVLAINPTKIPCRALPGVLGKRARPHWDALNTRLQSLKKNAKSKTAPLSRIAWDAIQNDYTVREFAQEAKPVSRELVETIREEVGKSVRAIRLPKTEMECTCVLFTLFRELFANCSPQVKMSLQSNLQSQNNVLEAAGVADFVFYRRNSYRRDIRVCVMEAKKVKHDEEKDEEGENGEKGEEGENGEEGEEDETTRCEDPEYDELKEMADGFAQALVGMELQNTFKKNPNNSVRGIVSNYTSWTFIHLEYPDDGSLPIVSRDEDRLVSSIYEKPSDVNLARILGKIMATVAVD